MKRFPLMNAAVLSLLSFGAAADSYGPFLCTTCDLSSPIAFGETRAFISDTVNSSRPPADGGWDPGDTVMICDGAICSTYSYHASAQFFNIFTGEDNNGGQYVNGGDPNAGSGGSGSGGGTGSTGTGGLGPGPWGGDGGGGGGGGWICWSNGSGVTCRPIQHN